MIYGLTTYKCEGTEEGELGKGSVLPVNGLANDHKC
jgi:hypothetical protein